MALACSTMHLDCLQASRASQKACKIHFRTRPDRARPSRTEPERPRPDPRSDCLKCSARLACVSALGWLRLRICKPSLQSRWPGTSGTTSQDSRRPPARRPENLQAEWPGISETEARNASLMLPLGAERPTVQQFFHRSSGEKDMGLEKTMSRPFRETFAQVPRRVASLADPSRFKPTRPLGDSRLNSGRSFPDCFPVGWSRI